MCFKRAEGVVRPSLGQYLVLRPQEVDSSISVEELVLIFQTSGLADAPWKYLEI